MGIQDARNMGNVNNVNHVKEFWEDPRGPADFRRFAPSPGNSSIVEGFIRHRPPEPLLYCLRFPKGPCLPAVAPALRPAHPHLCQHLCQHPWQHFSGIPFPEVVIDLPGYRAPFPKTTKVRQKYRSSKWHCRQRKIIFELIMHFVADTDTDENSFGIYFP